MRVTVSAPGKVILLGEHAVVYGEPAIALAIDRRTRVRARPSAASTTINGEPLSAHAHAYIRQAIQLLWKDEHGLSIETESTVPSAAGLGSSAALSVATVGALLALTDRFSEEECARSAYDVEFATQGRASPTDTSCASHGKAILIGPDGDRSALWRIRRGERSWTVQGIELPRLTLVVGSTGERGRTADQVAKVARFVDRSSFGRDVVRDIGRLVREGLEALRTEDLRRLGKVMDRDHALLTILGVSTPTIERMVAAARPASLGVKLTGAGGGGSVIALTERPADVVAAWKRMGHDAFIAEPAARGVAVEEKGDPT
ncbi:MAG: mevalonate kinase [Methanobacteriota archaeon]